MLAFILKHNRVLELPPTTTSMAVTTIESSSWMHLFVSINQQLISAIKDVKVMNLAEFTAIQIKKAWSLPFFLHWSSVLAPFSSLFPKTCCEYQQTTCSKWRWDPTSYYASFSRTQSTFLELSIYKLFKWHKLLKCHAVVHTFSWAQKAKASCHTPPPPPQQRYAHSGSHWQLMDIK